MNDQDMRGLIVQAGRRMSEKGLVGANEGNISARLGDRLYMTPSGRSKEQLRPEDVVVTDLEGRVMEGALKPTSEAILHRECYRLRPDVGGVVHCHAPYSTAWASACTPVILKNNTEFLTLFGMVPLLRYGRPGTAAVAADLPGYINEYDVFLLANHGMLAVGNTLQSAFAKAVSLEMVLAGEFVRRGMFGHCPAAELGAEECAALAEQGRPNRGYRG